MAKKQEKSLLFDAPGPKALKKIRIANIVACVVFALIVIALLLRLSNPPEGENQLSWDLWNPAVEAEAWSDFYLPGLWMTLKASLLAVVGSIVFGLLFGLLRLLPSLILRSISAVVVEFCRAVPVLLLMIFLWRGFAFAGISGASYLSLIHI